MKAPRQIEKIILWLLVGGLILLALTLYLRQAQPSGPLTGALRLDSPTPTVIVSATSTIGSPGATPTVQATLTATNTVPSATQPPTATSTPPAATPPVPASATLTAPAAPDLDVANWVLYDDAEYGFSVRYPPNFTFSSRGPIGSEVLQETVFYNPSAYQPGISTDFNATIGLHVLANPEQFTSAEEWAEAHLIGSPDAGQKDVQFESYEIIRTFQAGQQEATYFTTHSVHGTTEYNVFIPLQDSHNVVLMYFYTNASEIEPIALAIASTLQLAP